MKLRSFLVACAYAFALLAFPLPEASAQAYPAKPVRLVVPFPPGGGADVTGRTLGQKLSEFIGQPVVVENRAGAGGNIATEHVARAEADGYTLLLTTSGHTSQPHLGKLTWDPIKDFAPVSLVVTYQLVLAVHPSVPANNVMELIAFAKANPGKLTNGSSGSGSNLHLGAELFKSAAGVNIVHVPYKGNAPMTLALLRGEIDLVFDSLTGPLAHIRSGKLKALAVTSGKRAAVLPGVPTMAEAGLTNYEHNAWTGVLAPAGTPKDIVARLGAEIAKAVRAQEVRERLGNLGYEPVSNTPEEFAALIAKDLARYGRIIKEAGIKAD